MLECLTKQNNNILRKLLHLLPIEKNGLLKNCVNSVVYSF